MKSINEKGTLFHIMKGSAKKKKKEKSGQSNIKQSNMDSQIQGILNPNTPPPLGQNNAPFNTGVNMMASSLIGQSNDILYGSQVYQGSQILPPPPLLPCQTPVNQGFVQSQTQMQPQTQPQNLGIYMNRSVNLPSSPNTSPNESSTAQIASALQSLDNRLSKIESQLNQQCQQMGQQNNRIQNIEHHVEQITVLQQTVTQIQTKVYSIDTDLTHVKSKHSEYEKSIQAYSNMCDDVLKSQVATNERINKLDEKIDYLLNSEIENMKLEHNNLKEDFLDSKTRQMCENLIFTGIPEVLLNPGEIENCEATLREFLSYQMAINDNIQFDRVHRLGRYKKRYSFPRPIIAKFHNYKAKEMVKQKAPVTLKNTNYGVREQYPEEYERRRKVLYPKMKSAKQNSENKVRMVKDTLYINNNKYKCGPNDTPVLVQVPDQSQNMRSQNQFAANHMATRPKYITTAAPGPLNRQYNVSQCDMQYMNQQPTFRPQRQSTSRPTPAYDTETFRNGYNTTARNSFIQRSYSCVDNVETDNTFTPLREPVPVNSATGRYVVGKHPASSPADAEQTNKKQRENSINSDKEETFMTTLTISPTILPSQKTPSSVNPNSETIMNTQNTCTATTTTDTANGESVEIPTPSEPENHEISDQTVNEDGES